MVLPKCVTCGERRREVGIAIDTKAICADCLMESLSRKENKAMAEELNEFILNSRDALSRGKLGTAYWIYIQSTK